MLVLAALGLRAVVSPAILWSCVAMPGPPEYDESWQITQAGVASGSSTAAAQQRVASSNQSSYESPLRCGGEVFPAIDKDQFRVNTKKKHSHEGAPLDGAYCVDLAPIANWRLYDVAIMKKMVTILRHGLSCISDAIVWPDGFVFLEDVVRAEWKNKWEEFLLRFCKSYTN